MFGSFEITSTTLYTPLRNPLRWLHGVCNLIGVISSWTELKLRSILKQYMSTIQALLSYSQILRKRKTIGVTYTQRNLKYTHWKRFLVMCRIFWYVSPFSIVFLLYNDYKNYWEGQHGQTFRFNRNFWHWCVSENITLLKSGLQLEPTLCEWC